MAHLRSASQFLIVGWLAILLAGVITGDLVVDLAFEFPEFSNSTGAGPVSEEPDNSAEHVLMPSQRDDNPVGVTPVHVIAPVAASILPLEPHLSHVKGWPPSYFSEFSNPRGPSFLLALRI